MFNWICEAARARTFVHDDQPPRLRDRLRDRLHVERLQRPRVDDLELDSLAGELPRGLEREMRRGAGRDHRHVGPLALHVGHPDRNDELVRGHRALPRIEEPLLEDDKAPVRLRAAAGYLRLTSIKSKSAGKKK